MNVRVGLGSVAAVVLVGCGAKSPVVDAGYEVLPPVVDAGAPAPVDAGDPCGAMSHQGDGGRCVTEIQWAQVQAGPDARDHHATFLLEQTDGTATLYVTGGVDMVAGRAYNDLWYTALSADGLPTGWHKATGMLAPPSWHAGMGIGVVGQRAYVISGQGEGAGGRSDVVPRVDSLLIGADGLPKSWRQETSLPGAGRFHVTGATSGNFLYAIGGRDRDGVSHNDVYLAQIGADGVLSAWSAARALPEDRTHHTSFAYQNRLYVVGGFAAVDFTGDPMNHTDYLVATIDPATGALGEWQRHSLPFDMNTNSATVLGDKAYFVGGFDDVLNLEDWVQRSTIQADGTLGSFEALTKLPTARAHVHHTPAWKNRIYSVGGNYGAHVPEDTVLVGFVY